MKRRSWAEPYKIKVVEPIRMTTPDESTLVLGIETSCDETAVAVVEAFEPAYRSLPGSFRLLALCGDGVELLGRRRGSEHELLALRLAAGPNRDPHLVVAGDRSNGPIAHPEAGDFFETDTGLVETGAQLVESVEAAAVLARAEQDAW